jgi:inosine-uridine nucleoside N-ribohydrolase
MYHMILDTDLGIDDALALFLALSSPEITLEAITTVNGNVPVETSTRNVLALLELTGRTDIPVARGCERPLIRPAIDAKHIHGENGLGNAVLAEPSITPVAQHAVDLLIERIMAHPKRITVVCIGPLTNVALALRREPRIATHIYELVIMGGALRVHGNVTPTAEYNIYADPHAAHIVLHSGCPIRLVSLDVTTVTLFKPQQIASLPDNRVTKLIKFMTDYSFRFSAALDNTHGFPMHDPLCVGAVIQPDLIAWQPCYVDVELAEGANLGATVAQWDRHDVPLGGRANVHASVGVEGERFIELFVERCSAFAAP